MTAQIRTTLVLLVVAVAILTACGDDDMVIGPLDPLSASSRRPHPRRGLATKRSVLGRTGPAYSRRIARCIAGIPHGQDGPVPRVLPGKSKLSQLTGGRRLGLSASGRTAPWSAGSTIGRKLQ